MSLIPHGLLLPPGGEMQLLQDFPKDWLEQLNSQSVKTQPCMLMHVALVFVSKQQQ